MREGAEPVQNDRILIVEDEGIVARDLGNVLKRMGYTIAAIAASGEAAIRQTDALRPDLVVMDILLKGEMDGIVAANEIRSRFDIPVILLTAYADEDTLQRAKRAEPYGYILKPFDAKTLRSNVEIALYRHRMERRAKESDKRFQLLRALEEARPGDRICCIYQTEEEHRAVLASFLQQGLERGEKVFYMAGAGAASSVLIHLQSEGLYLESYLKKGQLSILTADEAYMQAGLVDPDQMFALLQTEMKNAVREGYAALRFAGEATWATQQLANSGQALEYEIEMDRFFTENQCLALCLYHRQRFEPRVLLNALRTYPLIIVGMEVYRNFYYLPPAAPRDSDPVEAEFERSLQNLAEHKRAEQALRDSEKRYRTLFDSASDAIFIYDLEGRFLGVNRLACEHLGYSQDEWMQMTLADVNTPEFATLVPDRIQALRERGQLFFEAALVRRNGTTIPVEISSRIVEHDGKLAVLSIARDVAERKQAEDELNMYRHHLEELVRARTAELQVANEQHRQTKMALQESEERYHSLFEHVPVGLYRTTPDGQILDVNQALIQTLGYSDRSSLLAANVTEGYVHARDRLRWQKEMERKGTVTGFETQWRCRDGTAIWVRESARAVRDGEGRVLCYEGAVEDISREKLASFEGQKIGKELG
jgi:PAS domain S-box-containing protein